MDKKLDLYAELLVKQGVNLEKGEMLAISAPVHAADLVEKIAETAYKAGASKVTVFWGDSKLGKLSYIYQSDEVLTEVPDWLVASRDYLIEKKAAYINIISEMPDLLRDIEPKKIAMASRATGKALKRFRESTGSNRTRWCLAAYPNPEWAKKIFPDLDEESAVNKLWQYIHKTMRMDTPDALAAWKQHQQNLAKHSKVLNDAKIKSFHYKNSLGTDFTVSMPEGYEFTGAVEKSAYGRDFTANMPTEEVFSSPDYRTANGRLVAAIPLVRAGAIIKDFYLEFKDGVVVDFGAKEGYETLKQILDTDEGSRRLGEIALVGYNSPIQNLKTLFYNTLFDENASCHFAIGRGFPACIKNGNDYTREQLLEKGINDSLEHVDFMVGTADLSITAIKEDGTELVVFKDGDWAF